MTTTTTIPEAKVTYVTTPRDLHVLMPWLDVARCLRSAARDPRNDSMRSVIKIVIVADCDGKPIIWADPVVTTIGGGAQALDVLLNTLSGS